MLPCLVWREDHSGNLVFLCECIPTAFFQHVGAYVESLQHGEVMCGFLTFCTCLMDCTRFHSISLLSLCRFDAIENGLMLAQSWLKLMLHGNFLWIPFFVPIGEALNPGPHSYLHVNVINPTSLYGKVSDVLSLGDGVHCLSETSVTPKAAHLIRRECRKLHQFVQFSELARPKGNHGFNESLRGSNTGCAVMSNLHVHRAFNQVDANVWSSGRILDVFGSGQLSFDFSFSGCLLACQK